MLETPGIKWVVPCNGDRCRKAPGLVGVLRYATRFALPRFASPNPKFAEISPTTNEALQHIKAVKKPKFHVILPSKKII
jgi:hypothetical protein